MSEEDIHAMYVFDLNVFRNKEKPAVNADCWLIFTEAVGFEPTDPCGSTDFESVPL